MFLVSSVVITAAVASNWPFHPLRLTPRCHIFLPKVQLWLDFLWAKCIMKRSSLPHRCLQNHSMLTIHVSILSSLCFYSFCMCQAIDDYLLNVALTSPAHSPSPLPSLCLPTIQDVFQMPPSPYRFFYSFRPIWSLPCLSFYFYSDTGHRVLESEFLYFLVKFLLLLNC